MKFFKSAVALSTSLLMCMAAYAQTYIMGTSGNVSTCAGTFYDSGDTSGLYTDNENYTITFCSSSGQDLYIAFRQFRLEASFDSLYIYDGNSTAAPLIGGFSGTSSPGTVQSTNASHCLTFYFTSDASIQYLGWRAVIACGAPPPPPPVPACTDTINTQAFCSNTAYNFPADTGRTAQAGPDYGCLSTQPNPSWYYLQIDTSGNLDIRLSNTANRDVDFVCWGPFPNNLACSARLTIDNIIDCSYSINATEFINITGAQSGSYYVLCITNFSGQPTNFTLQTQGTSTASTNCAILCNITAMPAVPTACDGATNTYTTSGSVNLQYPPQPNDTLTITSSLGDTVKLYSPFPNPIPYTLPAHTANGAIVTVRAQFTRDTSCRFTTTYTAPQPCICTVSATNSSPACAGDSVNFTLATNGVVSSYNWTGPNGFTSTQAQPTVYNTAYADTGDYIITISTGSCTATDTTRLSLLAPPVFGAPVITNSTCSAGGSITATATGTGPFTYNWSNGTAGAVNSNLAAGPYTVTVTDGNGCTTTATYNVGAAPGAITFGAPIIVDITCNGAANGRITVSANGGTGAIDFVWSTVPPITGASVPALTGGTYSVTASDQNGCSASVSYVVNEPAAIVFGAPVIANATCTTGGSITASASGGTGTIGFVWSGGQTGASITNQSAGNYSVTATDQNGCTATASYTVGTSGNVVTLNAPTLTNVACAGGNNGSITANPVGGNGVYTYAWSTLQNTRTISTLVANQYSVTVSDGTGCSVSAVYTVTEPAALAVDSANVQNAGCGGATGSLTAYVSGGTPGYSYYWVAQSTSQTYSGQTITGLAADTYDLTVSDNLNCSATASYTIVAAAILTYTQSQTEVSCHGGNNGSATITVTSGTPPYQYNWNGTATGNATINGLAAGPLDVTITDANCSVTANFVITEPTPVQLALVNQTDVSCFGGANGSVEVLATGGTGAFTYAWNSNPAQTAALAANLPAGAITVTATDANLCTITQTFTLTQPDTLTLALSHLNATCYQAPNGSISSVVAGGTAPYTYLWSDNQTTASAFGLLKGTYLVTVTDSKGCTVQGFDTIGEPDEMVIDLSVTAVKCVDDKNGTITVVANGGTSPYNYSATQDGSNFINTTDGLILGLAIGTYTVIISDNNGCTQTRFATIPNASIDNFITSTDSTSCYGTDYNDGGAHIEAISIQNGPYLYAVDGGGTQYSGDFSFLSAGYHTITATSNFGCVSEVPVLVLQPLPIVVDVVPDTVFLPLGQSQQVAVTYLNAPGQVSYAWTPELGLSCTDCPNPVVSPFTEQDYVITLSMVNGNATCYGSATLHASLTEALPLFIPSAFTPNGDGNNDLFQVYGQGIKKVDMKIFNRWGELVYQSNNQFSGWDGTYKGQVQQPQVLTYTVSVVFLDDTKAEKNGTITLVR